MEVQVQPAEILKRPYARILTPDPDGRVTAEIMEFPGCVAYGDNTAEALAHLEEVAVEWIDAALEQGQEIPEPMDNTEYSGRLGLRMTGGLHRRAAMCAEREGVSLNQFINICIAEAVGERAKPAAAVFYPNLVQATASLTVQIVGGSSNIGALTPVLTRVGERKLI
jgi:predicted RNase H-like HicB family nuclease